jgi:hypothetical protein
LTPNQGELEIELEGEPGGDVGGRPPRNVSFVRIDVADAAADSSADERRARTTATKELERRESSIVASDDPATVG